MSGGGIGSQEGDDDRQVVIFTFSGRLKKADVDAWNAAIGGLLQQFTSRSLVGATIAGAQRSPKANPRKRPPT